MIQIREMTTQDKPSLRQLYLESRRETFYWDDPELMHIEDFDRDTEDELIFVAESQQKIIGFISLYVPDNFIHCLFVDSSFKGQGAGHLLLEKAKQQLQRPLKLKCLSRNAPALAFYEKEGWEKVHEVKIRDAYWNMIYR
ncbi:GNAT family N-acetyltransferase [Enterococcus hulanensis]|uniref:GNAT family N-acetyltransferase n=1 Tax=Enterococcus hulanensis TaxID=2559929 RepID=A0ABU3EUH1_9ENTE|nr:MULTISPECIES: GNAT family N-acetyltransferase [Enterococcus]MDT2598515.1 GNAT family N-acetyltransferase [Enterococcus hulanensis]MDT2607980.1 GNAT family N-acetyltransferase [Enterococcus hulanensis]MDT2615275.1 GNAT family N-acetyltransferase [Enterococcus hulanensis]MDT2626754.1 GNAT family N-acetyltransferase [Enterococcus hulanensis]MDT2654347.1 GNAT family N-acetyltransferase [Enterococcus hulanensis]